MHPRRELLLAVTTAFLAGVLFGGAVGVLLGATIRPAGVAVGSGTPPSPPVVDASPSPVSPPSQPSLDPSLPDPSPAETILVGAGDIASCDKDGDASTAALVERIPGIVFTLGDNAYEDGSHDDFRCYDENWGAFRDRTRPVPGNHDFETRDGAGYFQYFGEAAGPRPTGYYAYDAGEWRIYVLNSNCGPAGGCESDSPQISWLRDDLAANPRRCVLAMWHHPVFSSGRHGNDPKMRPAWRALQDAGADLILNGHDHTYERFAPQDVDGVADERGIREFVVGTGGKSHYPFPQVRPNSEVRDNRSYGVLKLTLEPDSYEWEFIPIAGDSFTDQGRGPCH